MKRIKKGHVRRFHHLKKSARKKERVNYFCNQVKYRHNGSLPSYMPQCRYIAARFSEMPVPGAVSPVPCRLLFARARAAISARRLSAERRRVLARQSGRLPPPLDVRFECHHLKVDYLPVLNGNRNSKLISINIYFYDKRFLQHYT